MTQEAIKMGLTAEDLAVIEKAYREHPDDLKVRVAYLETGIREVRARLASMKDCGELRLAWRSPSVCSTRFCRRVTRRWGYQS